MKMRKTILLLLLTAAIITSSLVFNGCGKMKLEGTRLSNEPPTVEWALIPQDSTRYSRNPELQWIGKDLDGQLLNMDFQYTVVLKDEADNLGGPAAMTVDFPDTIMWTSLGYATSATIPLYASEDTSVYVDQYVFLRCIDDRGAYSNIIYLLLSRNNHPPTCSILAPGGPLWCLPDTSDYWKGIKVSWAGKDSIDYPGYIQPDFLWNTRIYGPFPDSISMDTTSLYLYTIQDPETGDTLTSLEDYTFTDLETGWYVIYTRNFDDAFVPAVPALGYLDVYEPNWIRHPNETKDILVVNHSRFANLPGDLGTTWSDSVPIFYQNLMSYAGIDNSKWDWSDTPVTTDSVLYNYRMLIIDDIDWDRSLYLDNTDIEGIYAEYLSIGGKIWINGRFSFATVSNQTGRVEFGPNDNHALAYTFMDISAANYPPASFTQAEFVGANPTSSGVGFPALDVDTLKIQALAGSYDYALPRVEYLIRNVNSQTIYTFRAIDPDTSLFNGFPVAIRNQNDVFKTSYFSFPLFFIKFDQAKVVADDMITWFLRE